MCTSADKGILRTCMDIVTARANNVQSRNRCRPAYKSNVVFLKIDISTYCASTLAGLCACTKRVARERLHEEAQGAESSHDTAKTEFQMSA